MGSEPTQLTGPDLAAGIDEQSLQPGVPLLGHARGEPVLLVRQAEQIFAVGAKCPHYGSSLADGLVVGTTIRCPSHHACFDLRTGAVTRAPALDGVACYQIARVAGRVTVGAAIPRPGPKAEAPSDVQRVLIVGAGAAGHAAAEALRRQGFTGSVILAGRDEDAPYDRPNLSKDYLAGTAPEAWMPLRAREYYGEHGIDLLTGVRVMAIDVANRRVALSNERALPFDRLLLATGSEPARLDVPGGDDPRVHVLRSFADCRRLVAAASAARRVVIVGSGFIGLEAAAALRSRDLEVSIVSVDREPLARVFGTKVGAFLRAVHEAHGVAFHLASGVRAIVPEGVELADGKRLAADLVLVAVGVRPATALAEAAGLQVDRGIRVDARLETSAPGIFAAGDVARFPYLGNGEPVRIEHWVVAQRMGAVAAANMLGAQQAFTDVPFFWTAQYDLQLSLVGHSEKPADLLEVSIDGDLAGRDARVSYADGGRRVAVLTVGRDRELLEAEREMESAPTP